ncbi:MAG: hypothetical protein M1533_03770 [Candidatus Thermoplasmatota archaeon]|jgi:hypothetical protein|nr:hypothetical protein [Candidatus Thermoplasmatota archaeon]MCL5794420.1 hypothetical protein [Candidatus Thermoplasmatota archaeon]
MTGDRFNYYLRVIINSDVKDYASILDQLGNDDSVSEAEQFELMSLIRRSFSSANSRFSFKVVNERTGVEENPPRSIADDFGETCNFEGVEEKYGISWSVYSPKGIFLSSTVKRWYYSQRIMEILGEVLCARGSDRSPDYFHTPPWIMGTAYAPEMKYLPLQEIINGSIESGLIPNWEYLIAVGVPADFINAIRSASPDFPR